MTDGPKDTPGMAHMIKLMKANYPDQTDDAIRQMLTDLAKPPTYPDPMPPLWEAFPNIGRWPSMGWRMGPGEDYFHTFAEWFRALPDDRRKAYMTDHAEPPSYAGLYNTLMSPRR